MNLQPITSAERLPFRFNCAGCDKHQRSDTAPDARADLDAKAMTFYCGDCVRLLVEHAGRLDARVLSRRSRSTTAHNATLTRALRTIERNTNEPPL